LFQFETCAFGDFATLLARFGIFNHASRSHAFSDLSGAGSGSAIP
jgi:hypothetical protein